MKTQSGRKALIMLTDSEDNASKISLQEAISSANRTSTMAYTIRIADDEQLPFNRGFGGPGMGRHGGGYFEVTKKKSVDDIYASIDEELRHQCSIGYTSDGSSAESNFRKIDLTVKKKGLAVQARDGYYPSTSKL